MGKKMSRVAFSEAKRYISGGVDSPVRAFKAVGSEPLFVQKGEGSKIYDIDGNEYIDYVGSWGPAILGHASKEVIDAVGKIAERGLSFGAPTILETELAKRITEAIPSIERVRFVSSGTEAAMSALRLARGFTNRENIVKFEGCYHGHADSLLVKAGSGAATFGNPTSLGVPQDFARHTIVLPYNDIDACYNAFKDGGNTIACIIVEPIAGNMGTVLPDENFLGDLREITLKYKTILIFDEVLTGFRITYGGYQNLIGVKPDLTCLGKVIGGGMPVALYGGKEGIMSLISPQGGVYQAGTLSGNPLAMISGIKTLDILKREKPYLYLHQKTEEIALGLEEEARRNDLLVKASFIGSMFTLFFCDKVPKNFDMVNRCDTSLFSQYFSGMLENGIY
ncbi:MAG: glutamate-1-semialdehyde 2,1-aminomutase, partial [Deltaproteobacteria bacterium]|nr:glutamate-1-semialdehyde 2,1-aminomutase [Deltaproteobacteria bacterium]